MSNIIALPLATENLTIRRLQQTDWPLFCRLYSDEKIMAHLGRPWKLEPLQEKFKQRLTQWHRDTFEWLTLVVELNEPPSPKPPVKNDHASIGIFGIRCINYESRIAEIYLLIEQKYQNQGHANETLNRLIPYIFYNLNYHKVVASCTKNNLPAQKALLRSEFKQEGILRHNSFIEDHFVDDYYYGLLIDEYHS